MKHSKIAIIGAGSVGATTAYALMLRNITAEIMIVDIDEVRCTGEIYDLSDALSFCGPSEIRVGTSKEASQADIIIIAAGARQQPGQSRDDLLTTNKKVVESVFKKLKPIKPDAIIVMVTNPVDIMTFYAQEFSGLPRNQVFGSGTFLDTQRLRLLLSDKLNIGEQSIHAYILGDHGENQFPAWSCAYVAGIPLLNFPQLNQKELESIAQKTKQKASEIIACKGSTFYGIAMCVAAICRTIIFDQKRVTPLSCYSKEFDVCFSLPVVLGGKGIEEILTIPLNESERKKLTHSAQELKKIMK